MDLPDQLRTALAGRYEVEREVGVGGMAIVYLARDVRHSRRAALLRHALRRGRVAAEEAGPREAAADRGGAARSDRGRRRVATPATNLDQFDVTSDGQRFLFLARTGESDGPAPMTVVVNWRSSLEEN
jgi:hypothetical protein